MLEHMLEPAMLEQTKDLEPIMPKKNSDPEPNSFEEESESVPESNLKIERSLNVN